MYQVFCTRRSTIVATDLCQPTSGSKVRVKIFKYTGTEKVCRNQLLNSDFFRFLFFIRRRLTTLFEFWFISQWKGERVGFYVRLQSSRYIKDIQGAAAATRQIQNPASQRIRNPPFYSIHSYIHWSLMFRCCFFGVFSFDDYWFMFSAFFSLHSSTPPLYDPFCLRKYSYSLVGVVMISPHSYCEVLVDIDY